MRITKCLTARDISTEKEVVQYLTILFVFFP